MRFVAFGILLTSIGWSQTTPPTMVRTPDLFGDQVAFSAEGDLWLADISTGKAQRLTSWPGTESMPRFSPDGQQLAFIADIDGRSDVYTVAVTGGQPKRITFEPGRALNVDWTRDGKALRFISTRWTPFRDSMLYEVAAGGGPVKQLPFPTVGYASQDPASDAFVYTRIPPDSNNWDRYRGGQANDIFWADSASGKVTKIVGTEFNEEYPLILGSTVYFVSENNGVANLYSWSKGSGKVTQATQLTHRVSAPASDGKRIVFSTGNSLSIFDPQTKKVQEIPLTLLTDRIHARPFSARAQVQESSIGPTGKRVLVTYRGQVFSAAAEDGDIRPVAAQSGIHAKLARWSPNGKVIAWVSDANDEWNIWIKPADDSAPAKQMTNLKGFDATELRWAPNSLYLVAIDNAGALKKFMFGSGDSTTITEGGVDGVRNFAISPDARFICYSQSEAFNSSSLYLFDSSDGSTKRLTQKPFFDGFPAFDRNSRWLYFISSRHVTQQWDNFDFNMYSGDSQEVFAFNIVKNTPNPFLEKVQEEGGPEEKEPDPKIEYQLDNLQDQLIKLPVPAGELSNLQAGSQKVLFLDGGTLKMFDMVSKKLSTIAEGISNYEISGNGKSVLLMRGGDLSVGSLGEGDGKPVPLAGWAVQVDPPKEWRQILREGWRYIRDNFYDPKLHGADWEAIWKQLADELPSVGYRSDLTTLIARMQAAVNVSHMFAGGGDVRFKSPPALSGPGYLGADLAWSSEGAYKIVHLLRGDGFEFDAISPLLQPGLNIKEGMFLRSIDQVELKESTNIDALLISSGAKLTRIGVSDTATGAVRQVWVKLPSVESTARYLDWTSKNRQAVDKLSAGKIAYIHVPDMGENGMVEFTKHFYSNLDKDGLIIDVRANGGGITSGMILERLRRIIFEYDQGRYGAPVPYHRMGFLSRVAVICNEGTASDGEYFCTGFRAMKLGPTIGTRTWGGFVAVGGTNTVDGGYISCPVQGSFSPEGKWLPDGYGFKPDIEVEESVDLWRQGRDAQLEKAVEVVQGLIKSKPPKRLGRMTPPTKK